jgi:Lon protease-like protein
MAALHAATLAPKNVTLPLFDAGEGAQHVVCFPRGIAILKVLSPRHRLLIQRALESHQHFALQQHSKHAIVAKILEHSEEREGNLLVKIRCGQRIQFAHTAVEPNSHGLQYLQGSLFVDQPVFRRNSKALDELQKRVRRLFFISDSDACATARADSIGNPLHYKPKASYTSRLRPHTLVA